MTHINVLNRGDEVIFISDSYLAVRRKKGQVDIYQVMTGEGAFTIDPIRVAVIGYGEGTVETEAEDGTTKFISF